MTAASVSASALIHMLHAGKCGPYELPLANFGCVRIVQVCLHTFSSTLGTGGRKLTAEQVTTEKSRCHVTIRRVLVIYHSTSMVGLSQLSGLAAPPSFGVEAHPPSEPSLSTYVPLPPDTPLSP